MIGSNSYIQDEKRFKYYMNIYKSVLKLYSILNDWDKKLWYGCHIHIDDLISDGNSENYRTAHIAPYLSQIITGESLRHLLSVNYHMNNGLRSFHSRMTMNYTLPISQRKTEWQCLKYALFNDYCSKKAFRKCNDFINTFPNDENKFLYLYQGNYQYKLLTYNNKFLILNLLISKLINNSDNLQLCILPLFMNISNKKLAHLSHIKYSIICALRKPYSKAWLHTYDSLTYQDAKQLSHICIDYLKNPHTSILMTDGALLKDGTKSKVIWQTYYIKPVINYKQALKKSNSDFLKAKSYFRECRMSSKKGDDINE